MASVIEQANALVSDKGRDFSTRASIGELERQQQEANNSQSVAQQKQEVYQAISKFHTSNAEGEKANGQQMMRSGTAKKTAGGALIGIGGAMVAIGLGLMVLGGAGAGLIASGMTSIGTGVGKVIEGGVDHANGKAALARYQEKLDLATANNVLSKEENKVVKKEMTRYEIFRQKKELLEAMIGVLKPMLEQSGVAGEDLTEDQLEKWFEKLLEKGGDVLAKGGLLETDLKGLDGEAMFADESGSPLEGTFYFMRDEDSGEFYQIDIARDENGDAITGAFDEPILDKDRGVSLVEDGDLKDFLKLQFEFVDQAAKIASSLGSTEVNDSGEVMYHAYDVNNIEDMQEFASLLSSTNFADIESGKVKAPLKTIIEPDGVYMQEWDYNLNIPLGPKIPVYEIAGGDFDRGDIDSYENALTRSNDALTALDLQAGGERFNQVSSMLDFSPVSFTEGSGTNFSDITSRDSDAFRDFANLSSSLEVSKSERDLLSGSRADNLPGGSA